MRVIVVAQREGRPAAGPRLDAVRIGARAPHLCTDWKPADWELGLAAPICRTPSTLPRP